MKERERIGKDMCLGWVSTEDEGLDECLVRIDYSGGRKMRDRGVTKYIRK